MTAAGEGLVLGLLRTAGLDVALPLTALREVVPCPEELADVPVEAAGSGSAVLGMLSLRGTVVPVVDLVHLLGRPHVRAHGQVVVVLAAQGLLVGLLVDEVRGLATVAAQDLTPVTRAEGGLLFSSTFHHPELGHVVSTLDPAAVLARPGVLAVRDTPRVAAATEVGSGRTEPPRALTLVRCGAFTLALDVAAVHSTVPSPALRRSPADGPTCLGTTPVAGSDVAVVDLLALLGLGSLAGEPLDCGLVLDLPDGQVVLGVSAMVGLQDVPRSAVLALPASATPSPELLGEVADVPGVGACLLVDAARLVTAPDVVALSRVTTPSDDAGQDGGTPAARAALTGPAHLAYSAGVDVATPLAQVAEVLAHPADLVPSSGAHGVLGFVLHRGTAVPVLCLSTLLGRPASEVTPVSRLLLLDVDGDPVAYAVPALHAILGLVWRDETAASVASSDRLRRSPLVQLEGSPGLLPVLDLVGLTRDLRGTTVPGPRTADHDAPVQEEALV